MRKPIDMQPTPLKRIVKSDSLRDLEIRLADLAEVRDWQEAEEPILAPATRAAVASWLAEINARAELAAVGLKPRSTALLSGPPGTGKTTLAHHLAARLKLPLVIVGAENILASLLGASEKNVAKLFDTLQGQKVVVLMDEIDALGMKRDGMGDSSAGQAKISTLTVLLRKIEQFDGFLCAATNRPGAIDSALWRRFHLQITVGLPGEDERWAILKRYGAPYAFSDDDLDLLADLTAGASPALLRGLMEGLKRALVLGERASRMPDAVTTVARVLASLQPPPGIDTPPLWRDADTVNLLAELGWPPARSNPSGGKPDG